MLTASHTQSRVSQVYYYQTFDDIAATMRDIMHKIGDRQRHTTRAVHAKSHALVKAEMTVREGLPEPLRQGLAARPGTYGVILRFSTNPGDVLSDHISSPRGCAVKIIGLDGEKLPHHAGEVTQDFLMVNGKVFDVPDAAGFLKNMQLLDKNANTPEAVKQAVSTASRIGETVLETVGLESAFLKGFGHPTTTNSARPATRRRRYVGATTSARWACSRFRKT